MGHITYIADEVCKLIEKCAADFEVELKGIFCFVFVKEMNVNIFGYQI